MVMASRPLVVILVLMALVVVSQLELKIEVVNKMDQGARLDMKKQWELIRREAVQQRIILSQENRIRQLNKLVSDLQEELVLCKRDNGTV